MASSKTRRTEEETLSDQDFEGLIIVGEETECADDIWEYYEMHKALAVTHEEEPEGKIKTDIIWRYRIMQEAHSTHLFPREHWRRIRTTNGLERINKELKTRSRGVGAFPSDKSFMRLGMSILIDINEEWMTTRKYLSMDME